MKPILASVILILSSALRAAQPAAPDKPVTPVPVAKDMLDGTRLVLTSARCSIDVPNSAWSWMSYDKSGKNFLCMNTKTMELYGVSVDELKSDMTDHHPQSLIGSARKTMDARGGKLENDKYDFIDIPGTKKSARVTFNEIDKTQKKTFVCIYIINTVEHVLLKIHCNSTGAAEPDALKAIVKSLKMLK